MTRLLHTFILAICLTTTIAAPTVSRAKRSFKVHRLEQNDYIPNGKAALKRAYLKFGLGDIAFKPNGEAAARIKAATGSSVTGGGDDDNGKTEDGGTSAVATQSDAQFLSLVMVGGQKLVMNFDSGSADFWVFNTLMNLSEEDRQGHDFYNPGKSNNAQEYKKATFNITYGDQSSCSGPVYFDQVDIGGSTVNGQAIGLATSISKSFIADTASNGLVGLAFSTLNTITPKSQRTFFENVVDDLSLPLFTAQLKGGTVGSYEFGRIDETAYTGDLTEVPIDNGQGFWKFDSPTAIVNGKTIEIPNGKAIADTGTSLMLVQDEILSGYWNQVDGAYHSDHDAGYIFPCKAKLPDLQIAVGPSYMASIPGVHMNYGRAATGTEAGVEFCYGGLQGNGGHSFAIFGDVWFKSQYVVFQATGPSIGIAPHS